MRLEELIFCLQCGEEIEVSVGDKKFFIQPQYGIVDEKENEYLLFKVFFYEDDEQNCQLIFSGDIEKLVSFQFDNDCTFKDNIEKFRFFDGCYITEE